jgi:trans-aconitate methyltransferase
LSTTAINTTWDPDLYEDKHSFVFRYGEDLVRLLDPGPAERILDLGCGTGYLTNLIAAAGARVTGIDNSADMIARATKEYPQIEFKNLSITEAHFDQPFDAIFSNAALHWVLEKEKAVDRICENLKTGGRLVVEMGGKGNVQSIVTAIKKILNQHGFGERAATEIWYFPSLSQYVSLLEQRGLRVTFAAHYDRETLLSESDQAMKDWIKMFSNTFFQDMDAETTDKMLDEIQDRLTVTNFRDGKWYADYKRLRVTAIKEDELPGGDGRFS